MQHAALHNRLTELATDIGRLRRTLPQGGLDEWRTERIASHVTALITMLEPSAAELARYYYPGDETTISEAIRVVDARHNALQKRLGAS